MRRISYIHRTYVVVAILISLWLVGCGGSSSRPKTEMTPEQKQKMEGFDALDKKVAEYTSIPDKEQLSPEPYLKKKFLVFGYDSRANDKKYAWTRNYFGTDKMGSTLFSKDYEKLESKLAKSPDEVGIIALIPECKTVDGGTYSGQGKSVAASKERCEVVLIDPEISAVVYRRVFEGELDRSKTVGSGEPGVVGRVDGKQIIDFLDSLKSK